MIVETKLESRDVIRYTFILTYTHPVILAAYSFFVLAFIYLAIMYFSNQTNSVFGLVFALFFLIYIPSATYFRTKSRYKSNSLIHEKVIYEFTPEKIVKTGESFKTEMTWSAIYKVKEINGCVLLYQSKALASYVPVESFGNKFGEFKRLVKSIPGLKYKFRESSVFAGLGDHQTNGLLD